MTKFGITYLGHTKDEFGYTVMFQVKGKVYMYELPFYWMEKIILIARHSEPKALNMAKKVGELINTRRVRDGHTERAVDKARASTEERSDVTPRSETLRSDNTNDSGQHVAEQNTPSAILKARNLVQKSRNEGNTGRKQL